VRFDETNMGGQEKAFSEAASDLVSGLRSPEAGRYTAAFDVFCANYWKPVYAYIRTAWAKGNEEAKDLTQAFFLWLAESDAIRKFEPARGSLRRYLRVLLRSFLGHQEEALARHKRGGASKHLSLDTVPTELEDVLTDPRSPDPEAAYDRAWSATVLGHAIRRLGDRCAAEGRLDAYLLFENYDLRPDAVRPTYKDLAAKFQVDEAEVRKRLLEMREALRAEIRGELSRYAVGDGDVESEWSVLFTS
jgi:RNA polymerase sigma factor (sigma-70 family)